MKNAFTIEKDASIRSVRIKSIEGNWVDVDGAEYFSDFSGVRHHPDFVSNTKDEAYTAASNLKSKWIEEIEQEIREKEDLLYGLKAYTAIVGEV